MARLRILQVFSRYLHFGGEELSVRRICSHLETDHEVIQFDIDNREWVGPSAPSIFQQARRTVYNPDSRRRFEHAVAEHRPDLAMFHNIYPVGSPSLYHGACRLGLPVVQYAHNYRPFSVSGALFTGGKIDTSSLTGNYWPEIQHGAWQNSRLKTALLAFAFWRLRKAGWLESVKAWVCVSEFMCDKFVSAGVPADRVFGVRYAWEPMTNPPPQEDKGYYLFLSRLVDVKGVEVLLEAWNKLHEKLGARTPELRVAGEGALAGKVHAAAARNPCIKMVGMLQGDDKCEALRCCRAVIFPSIWWEPMGLVTYEAYDFSKPVLAAASGGLTETVMDGVTGFLHEPGNREKIISDVLVMDSLPPEKRAAMGRAGRKWLMENTTMESWKQKFALVLDKALESRPENGGSGGSRK